MSKNRNPIKKLNENAFRMDHDYKSHADIDWDAIFNYEEPVDEEDEPYAPEPDMHNDVDTPVHLPATVPTDAMSPADSMRNMMSKINIRPGDNMDPDEIDTDEMYPDMEPEISQSNSIPVAPITPADVPAVIHREIAMTDPHAVNPAWHAVSNLPGNMSQAVLALGNVLFGPFTNTPAGDIVTIANLSGQGPNTAREVRSVGAWVQEHGQLVDSSSIQVDSAAPGYHAEVKQYTVNGIRFKLVNDQFGDYIYAWPDTDSTDTGRQIGPTVPTDRLTSR